MTQTLNTILPTSKCFACIFILVTIFFLGSQNSQAQQMQTGFTLLEKGKFSEAQAFFFKVLEEYPSNTTAKICYGRAVGLSGNSKQALEIFNELDQLSPNNTEILLNMAEAYLWDGNGLKALEIFQSIIENDSSIFNGWLGLANSYSIEKIYDKAYQSIKTAISLDPSNQQALTSKKYIILGYANQLSKDKNSLGRAFELLAENLSINAADQETLGLKASLFISQKKFTSALDTYELLTDVTKKYIGKSIANHLLDKNEKALELAEELLTISVQDKDSLNLIKAKHHYLNALLWNDQLREAKSYVDSLSTNDPTMNGLTLNKAKVAVYTGDYLKGIKFYQEHLLMDSASFEGNLALADTWHAVGMDQKSYFQTFRTLSYFPKQADAQNLIKKLNEEHNLKVSGLYQLSFASDGSHNRTVNVGTELSTSAQFKLKLDFQQKRYFAPELAGSSKSKKLGLLLQYRIHPRVQLSGSMAVFQSRNLTEDAPTRSNQLIEAKANFFISKSQQLAIGYQSTVQDFNHSLLLENVKTNHLILKNIFNWRTSGIGNYTEIYRSFLSDGNTRSLIFTSLYKNLGKKKHFKSGINLLYFGFANQTTIYFSPASSRQAEGFLSYTKLWKSKHSIKLFAESALGTQSIEKTNQTTWRSSVSLTGKIGVCNARLYALYSTAVTAASNGFSYQQVGLELKFTLTEKPIFFKRMMKKYESNKDQ